jgi:hypothetical protein
VPPIEEAQVEEAPAAPAAEPVAEEKAKPKRRVGLRKKKDDK